VRLTPEFRAQLVGTAMTRCPDTKVVMSGYSQGGQLVHNAAKLLPPAVASKVAAAVIFGDPGIADNPSRPGDYTPTQNLIANSTQTNR